jgi:antitoxin component of MazEF toxin-antitoxin module
MPVDNIQQIAPIVIPAKAGIHGGVGPGLRRDDKERGKRANVPTLEEVMSKAIVGRWGKCLAIRLPGGVAEASDGERVDIAARDGDIVIRRAVPHVTLEGMFRGQTPQQWRAVYAGAYDWSTDIGREAVEE